MSYVLIHGWTHNAALLIYPLILSYISQFPGLANTFLIPLVVAFFFVLLHCIPGHPKDI